MARLQKPCTRGCIDPCTEDDVEVSREQPIRKGDPPYKWPQFPVTTATFPSVAVAEDIGGILSISELITATGLNYTQLLALLNITEDGSRFFADTFHVWLPCSEYLRGKSKQAWVPGFPRNAGGGKDGADIGECAQGLHQYRHRLSGHDGQGCYSFPSGKRKEGIRLAAGEFMTYELLIT